MSMIAIAIHRIATNIVVMVVVVAVIAVIAVVAVVAVVDAVVAIAVIVVVARAKYNTPCTSWKISARTRYGR